MKWIRILRNQFGIATCILLLLSRTTLAGLSGSPISYFIPAGDKHILVLLAPVSTEDDTKELAKLPNGKAVHLRNEFSQSGLYEIGSKKPIWTVNWHDGFCFLSPNTRHLVRIRDFGDFSHPADIGSGWAIKFYTDGRLAKQYDVDELIDFPSLIPPWYHSILRDDYIDGDLEIRNGKFVLNTFTHEKYQFDISTGEIVEQFRLWRTIARYSLVALTVSTVVLSVLLVQRVRARNAIAGNDVSQESRKTVARRQAHYFSFNLRSLFLATTLVALLCYSFIAFPHVAVLFSAFLVAIGFTVATIRAKNLAAGRISTFLEKAVRSSLMSITIFSWLFCYILSLAPIMGILESLDTPYDVKMAVAKVPFAPAYLLLTRTSLEKSEVVERYFDAWQVFGDN